MHAQCWVKAPGESLHQRHIDGRSDTAPHLYGLVWVNKGLGILTSYNKWLFLGLLLPITGYEYGQCSRGWQWLAGSSADCLQAQAGKRALPRPKVDQENHADDIALALLAHQHLHAGWLSSLLCSTPPPPPPRPTQARTVATQHFGHPHHRQNAHIWLPS